MGAAGCWQVMCLEEILEEIQKWYIAGCQLLVI